MQRIWATAMVIFQSTLPYGSDLEAEKALAEQVISIHAPLRERRAAEWIEYMGWFDFNPRSLTGATKVFD